MTATTGATVSAGAGILTLYESVFEAIERLPTASENIPVHTETVIVPVDPDGVTVIVYPVALLVRNPLTTPLIADTSASVRFIVGSDVTIFTDIAHVIVGVAVDERIAVGRVTSSTHVSIMPDATIWLWIDPE